MYEVGIGLLIAAFLAVGRWAPTRLTEDSAEAGNYLAEPRLWAVAGMLALVSLALLQRSSSPRPSNAYMPPAQSCLVMSLLSLFSFLGLSFFWAPDAELALTKAYEIGLMAVVCTVTIVCATHFHLERMVNSFWTGLFLFLLALAAMGVLMAVAGMRSTGSERLAVFGGGPNVFGRNMGLLVLCCLYFQDRWAKPLLFLPLATSAVILVLLSGSRGALLSTVTAMATYFALSPKRISSKLLISAAACIVLGVLLLLTEFGSTALERFQHRVLELTVGQGYSAGREVIADDALAIATRHWAFGHGLAGFKAETGTYPHNVFLEIACDAGLIGVAMFLASLGLVGYLAWQSRHSINPVHLAALALFFTFSQFSGDLFDSRSLFIMMLVVAFDRSNQASLSTTTS